MSVFYFIKTGFFLLVMLFAIIITIWMIRKFPIMNMTA